MVRVKEIEQGYLLGWRTTFTQTEDFYEGLSFDEFMMLHILGVSSPHLARRLTCSTANMNITKSMGFRERAL